jgi:hypothetical protein
MPFEGIIRWDHTVLSAAPPSCPPRLLRAFKSDDRLTGCLVYVADGDLVPVGR